jgi:hypothetical protein
MSKRGFIGGRGKGGGGEVFRVYGWGGKVEKKSLWWKQRVVTQKSIKEKRVS